MAEEHYQNHLPSESENFEELNKELIKKGYAPLKRYTENNPVNHPTVVILGYLDCNFVMLEEGGRLSPGNILLCLEPDWLEVSPVSEHLHKITVKKALFFDSDMQACCVDYKVPRTVDYFINFYSVGSFADVPEDDPNKHVVKEGIILETNFEGPMSNSAWLAKDVNDKILTRLLMMEKGVAVPRFIGFVTTFLRSVKPELVPYIEKGLVTLIPKDAEKMKGIIADKVSEFVKTYPQYQEVVVKPSGIRFSCGEGIKFFPVSEVNQITDHVIHLVSSYQLGVDESVLVDGRISPPPMIEDGIKKDHNFRVFVARNLNDEGEVTGVFSRIGKWGKPTNAATGARIDTLEAVIKGINLSEDDISKMWEKMRKTGYATLEAIKEHEKKRAHRINEPHDAQTDFMGLDVMLEERDGELHPVVIEINDHEAGGQQQIEDMHKGKGAEMLRVWMKTMMKRAEQHFSGKGKPVRHFRLVKHVNSSHELVTSMSNLHERAKQHGKLTKGSSQTLEKPKFVRSNSLLVHNIVTTSKN